MGQVITLNGKSYVAKSIRRYTVDPRGLQQRMTGEHQRSDNGKITSAIYDNWNEMGIGWRKNRRRTGRGVGGMWKSTSETRFAESAYNGLMETEQTHAAPLDHLVRYINFNGDLWGIFEKDYSTATIGIVTTGKYAASTPGYALTAGSAEIPQLNGSTAGGQNSGTSQTVSHTVQSTYGNRIVIARIVSGNTGTPAAPSGVTQAGNAMTKLVESVGASIISSIWYRVAPSTGSQDVVATWAESQDRGSVMYVGDYYFVDQSTPFGANAGAHNSSAQTISTGVATITKGGLALIAGGHEDHLNNMSVLADSGTPTEENETATTNIRSVFGRLREDYDRADQTYGVSTPGSASSIAVTYGVLRPPSGVIVHSSSLTEGVRAFDACLHKGICIVIGSAAGGNEQRVMAWKSTDMTTWTEIDGANWPTGNLLTTTVTRRNNYNDDFARLLDDGNKLWAFVRDDANNEIECLTSVDSGANWVAEFQIPSTDGPKGAAIWFDRAGTQFPLLATAEGIYSLDAANNVFVKEIALDGQAGNGRFMTVGDDGNLYIPLSDDDVLQARFSGQGSTGDPTLHLERIGPMAAHDGLPAVWRGDAHYVTSGNSVGGLATRWLWTAYGGSGAGKTGTIMCYDYAASAKQEFPVWHCFHDAQENSVSGMGQNVVITQLGLSAEDDGTPRLHATAEAAAASLMFEFAEPTVNHFAQGVTGKYLQNSYIQFAEDDHGDPHTSGALHIGRLDGAELANDADNNEEIEWTFGLLNDNFTFGTAPGAFAADVTSIALGSGLGVSATGSVHQLTFERRSGTTSERAVLHEFEVQYSKRVQTLKGYEILIDLDQSNKAEATYSTWEDKISSVEDTIAQLETVEASAVTVPLVIGSLATINVEVVGTDWALSLDTQGEALSGPIYSGAIVKGDVTLRLEERL